MGSLNPHASPGGRTDVIVYSVEETESQRGRKTTELTPLLRGGAGNVLKAI